MGIFLYIYEYIYIYILQANIGGFARLIFLVGATDVEVLPKTLSALHTTDKNRCSHQTLDIIISLFLFAPCNRQQQPSSVYMRSLKYLLAPYEEDETIYSLVLTKQEEK